MDYELLPFFFFSCQASYTDRRRDAGPFQLERSGPRVYRKSTHAAANEWRAWPDRLPIHATRLGGGPRAAGSQPPDGFAIVLAGVRGREGEHYGGRV